MSSRNEYLRGEQKFQQRVKVVGIANSQGTQTASIKSGIPERTVRLWKSKFKKMGLDGLRDRSRATKQVKNKKDRSGILTAALIRLHHEEPGLTRLQILVVLAAEDTDEVATLSWISRSRKRLGLTRKKRYRHNVHKKRYEIPVPLGIYKSTLRKWKRQVSQGNAFTSSLLSTNVPGFDF